MTNLDNDKAREISDEYIGCPWSCNGWIPRRLYRGDRYRAK